jgi:signal transduction histidine kinase
VRARLAAAGSALGLRRPTVYWRVAGVLVGVQLVTALLAVALPAFFEADRRAELLRGTLQLRLDATAEEVEQRAAFDPFGGIALSDPLRQDLPTRFPDPLVLLDESGGLLDPLGVAAPPRLPEPALAALASGRIAVSLDGPDGSWALAPVLAPDGLPAAAVLVRPLAATIEQELRGTRSAFLRATAATAVLAVALALLLGALFTARIVGPLRRVTDRVERLGAGDFADRLPQAGDDEMGRLVYAINDMAGHVEASMEALRQTDRLRRDLVANVGHDLRTPLAALRGYLEEAERFAGEGRADEVAEPLAAARRQAESAGDLVADLFELSLLEHPDGRIPLRRGPVPLGELLHDVAAQHARAYAADGVALRTEIPSGLPVLDADGSRLVRLLSNLLDNARHHTPARGVVTLAATTAGENVRVTVADTGAGIDAADHAAIFERYYSGAHARTRGETGTGLGLAIARAIARAHGGALDVQSRVGEGSTFTLTLPVEHGRVDLDEA